MKAIVEQDIPATSTTRSISTEPVPKQWLNEVLPLTLRTILVPTDLSPESLRALRYAMPLAKQCNATIHLTHVYDVEHLFSALTTVAMLTPEAELRAKLNTKLFEIAGKYLHTFKPDHCHVRMGRSWHGVCEDAQDVNADLIVISTHGHTGFKHVLLGSTAERVVQHAPCPVLVVREREHECVKSSGHNGTTQERIAPKKILVPVDFSECAGVGLSYALAFAKRFHSKVVLLHSVHSRYYATSDEYANRDLALLMKSECAVAAEQMRELTQNTSFDGIPFETEICLGHPVSDIANYAESHDVDVIITSTHGYTGFKHVLIGSTAEAMVRYARCPVLVVPSHAP